MSLYLEYPTSLSSSSSSRGSVLTTAFSSLDASGSHPLLAVSTADGSVSIFLDEGDPLELDHGDDAASIHRSAQCAQLAFHPKQNLLASGWSDGAVALWNERERVLREERSVHSEPVTLLSWSPDGSRLFSGDASGLLCVWTADQRGRLQLLVKYQKRSGITHLAFRQPHHVPLAGCPPFFFAVKSGLIYFADDAGHCTEVLNAGVELNYFTYSPLDYLVLVTVDVALYKYSITSDGRMVQERKVKLSIKGDGSELQCCMAGSGLLAAANNEGLLRLWHLERDENYVLVPSSGRDLLTCVAFNPRSRALAAGCQSGRVIFWKFLGDSREDTSGSAAEDWECQPGLETHNPVSALCWAPTDGLLACTAGARVSLLGETVMKTKYCKGNALIQLSSDSLLVQPAGGKSYQVQTSIRIKGCDLTDRHIIVWNGKKAEVREFSSSGVQLVSTFATRATIAALHGESIYCCTGPHIEICNLQGTVKHSIAVPETDGIPILIDINGDYLCVCTSTSQLKLWDISRREPKSLVPARQFSESLDGVSHLAVAIKSASVNCAGNRIGLIVNHRAQSGVESPDTRMFVYDVDLDRMLAFQFGPAFYPVALVWDQREEKLVAVQTKRSTIKPKKSAKSSKDREEKRPADSVELADSSLHSSEVVTLFATSDHGLLMQDAVKVDTNQEYIMGFDVPHLLFHHSGHLASSAADPEFTRILRKTMRDFVGLESVNEETRRDLLSFSYHLTVGNMDEAYRAVKKISSEAIWENMAQMCVKTKRLDVAEVCLGNMNNARGARAVREAKLKYAEKEAQIAAVAIQLNMIEDAERLLIECQRYDLLVDLLLACGRWNEAINLCSQHDRIHLKTTHYQFAKHLESLGDTAGAIKNYEKSLTHKVEVPRMLHDAGQLNELENYIKAANDTALFKWWAQFCESAQNFDDAIKYYQLAKDLLSMVRVLCYRGQEAKAIELCNQANDLSAAYHLARQFESQEKIPEALQFYKKAKRYAHGIRLAKESGQDAELLQLALECPDKAPKLDAAKYFESIQQFDRAVLLYQKGGRTSRAIELCFKANLFDSLRLISDNLSPDTDPALLSRVADFFLANQQFDKAVHLLIAAGQFDGALELCIKQNVKITDTMAEKMTPPKSKDERELASREEYLQRLATLCRDQGSYHLACKKFTQAGDHVKAMKCLLKSSDTEKIIYYASMTKKKEIYILAANFLQNLDWHADPEIMKKIIDFYTKARAMTQLAMFYDACAQVEIDEYRDYEKALAALKEALKYLIKGKSASDQEKETQLSTLDQRIRIVEKFVEARRAVKSDPETMIQLCNELLHSPALETAIRMGDVYALLCEYYVSVRDYQAAYETIERMKTAKIVLAPYLDNALLQQVYNAVGVKEKGRPQTSAQHRGRSQPEEDEGIGEEINEEYE